VLITEAKLKAPLNVLVNAVLIVIVEVADYSICAFKDANIDVAEPAEDPA